MREFINTNDKKIKLGIITGSILLGLYALFLVLPLAISPFINSRTAQIQTEIKNTTGIDVKIENLGIFTTPNFRAGVSIKNLLVQIPTEDKPFLQCSNPKVDIKLLPLLFKKIELGKISCKDLSANLTLKKDSSLLLLDYLNKNQKATADTDTQTQSSAILPFGLKLSNKLPDISVKQYKIGFTEIENNNEHFISGENFKISNFILNKKIKLAANGKVVLNKHVVSNYDIKILNKIMPDMDINDLLTSQNTEKEDENTDININIIEIFNSIAQNKLQLDINADLKTSGNAQNPILNGNIDIENLTAAVLGKQLPESYLKLAFKGNKTNIDSILFTSNDNDEKTQIIGSVTSGRKPSIDLTFRSNAKFNNIIRLLDSVAQTCGINDFKTITATGGIDADFNIDSNRNKVSSTGYLKILPSSINFGLYNTSIDNISADIDFMNNNVNIKNAGFAIKGHPLKLQGTITKDADTDIKITANKLALKGLLAASGQTAILNENEINNGTLSLNASIKGKLSALKPDIKLSFDNFDIKNKASQAKILLKNALLTFNQNTSKIAGNIDINSLIFNIENASASVPNARITANDKDIKISNTYILLGDSKINVTGAITNYLNSKLHLDIKARGNAAAANIAAFIPANMRSMFPYKGSLPVSVNITGNQNKQNIEATVTANPQNYLQLADINLLRGKNTKIHSKLAISNNNIEFENSGLYANSTQIASFGGSVENLSSPKLNLIINIPNDISFPIWGLANSNITANGKIDVLGSPENPKLKGKIFVKDISVKDMDFALSNLSANLNGTGIAGKAEAESIKFGGISAQKLSSDFHLKNYEQFYLNNAKGESFGGKVSGDIFYNIPTFGFEITAKGENMNSTDAVYGATGIPKALTGTLGFDAKLKAAGVTDKEIINSMTGNINFNINDGRFVSIGKLENLVAAQNVNSGSILKSALSALSTLTSVQEADKFKTINGEMSFSNGNAKISKIEVVGDLMSYYVNGIYSIIPNTANLIILGRLDAKIVSVLGPLGQLSAEKILSAIPGLGNLTKNYANLMTTDPDKEKIELIPALSSKSTNYKDFKVVYNGVAGQASAVKSFKWLSKCDTTPIDIKKELENSKEAIRSNIEGQVNAAKTTVENAKNTINNVVKTQKEAAQQQKQAFEQARNDIKNIKQNAGQSVTNFRNILKNAASNVNKTPQNP